MIEHSSISLNFEEASKIKNTGERVFAHVILLKPNLEIVYQPKTFVGIDGKKTVPDFYIRNTRTDSKGVYIEVTESLDLDNSSKSRQLRIMKQVRLIDPDIRYLQFNGAVLANLVRAFSSCLPADLNTELLVSKTTHASTQTKKLNS